MGNFLLWACEHVYVYVNIDVHLTWGLLKKLEVCDFAQTWSACQRDDGSYCEQFLEFLLGQFSYNQTKR